MTLFPETLFAHRDAVADRWALERGAVLVASGLPVPVAGTDGRARRGLTDVRCATIPARRDAAPGSPRRNRR